MSTSIEEHLKPLGVDPQERNIYSIEARNMTDVQIDDFRRAWQKLVAQGYMNRESIVVHTQDLSILPLGEFGYATAHRVLTELDGKRVTRKAWLEKNAPDKPHLVYDRERNLILHDPGDGRSQMPWTCIAQEDLTATDWVLAD